jgi:lipooligosaccharide transport system permease protein
MSFVKNFSLRAFHVWRRNAHVYLVTWGTNLLPPVLEPVLYVFAFGYGLRPFMKPIEYQGLVLDYLPFVAPGMIGMAIFFHSFYSCLYASFVRMRYQRTFDAIISTPLLIEDVIAGEILWGATQSLFAGTVMLVVISFFGLATFPSALIIFPLSFIGGLLFASFGMFFCAICPTIETMNLPVFLMATPMFLFSGTFFPIERFPAWGRILAEIFPLRHVVIIARAATLNHFKGVSVFNLIYLVVLTVFFALLSTYLMKRRLIK